MTWVRLDDGFARHPKVVAAGPLAMAMQVAALGYCNRELTDGFVPRGVARTLLDFEVEHDGKVFTLSYTCGMAGDDVTAAWVIDCLIEAGMWEEAPGGYQIHDYLAYQPSKEEVLALRETRAEIGRKGGLKRGENLREANEANAKQIAKQNPSKYPSKIEAKSNPTPVPVPTPSLDVSKTSSSHPPAGGYPADFEAFWKDYPSVTNNSKKKAHNAWRQLSQANRDLAVEWLPRFVASKGWREGFATHASTYLNGKLWESPPVDRSPPGVNGQLSEAEIAEFQRRSREALGQT